jgi:hypothetical protein
MTNLIAQATAARSKSADEKLCAEVCVEELFVFAQCRDYFDDVRLIRASFRQIDDRRQRFLSEFLAFASIQGRLFHVALLQSFAADPSGRVKSSVAVGSGQSAMPHIFTSLGTNLRSSQPPKPRNFTIVRSGIDLHRTLNARIHCRNFRLRRINMDHQFHRRAWALLIVIGSFVAAAAVWTLPEDCDPPRRTGTFHDAQESKA